MAGAMLAVLGGCVGSARGIRLAAGQSAGVLSEKPELFGQMLVLMALPGTQGFYGFIGAIIIALRVNLLAGGVTVAPIVGVALLFVGIALGSVLWRSAVYQGETSAACMNLVARRPEQGGRAIIMPALVETYAVVALLAAILMTLWLTADGLTVTNPLTAG
ncbi:MAG: permease [Candidatus Brocadiaceae bacterium]|nr:permease [Candidatus Brocadiaceae bacterium]